MIHVQKILAIFLIQSWIALSQLDVSDFFSTIL